MSAGQKVVVITGASRGIGAALVRACRNRNYRVIANSRFHKATADADILARPGDISLPATAERIVSEGLARFGRIDPLVNNAGVFLSEPFIDLTAEDYALNIGVNVSGSFTSPSVLLPRC